MLSLALSLALMAQPQPQPRNDWAGVGIGLLGASAFIGLFWRQIWEDEPNQRPRLAIVPPQEDPQLSPQTAEAEQAEMDRLLDAIAPALRADTQRQAIDSDAELSPTATSAPLPPVVALPKLSATEEPGKIDFELISKISYEHRQAWLTEYFEKHQLLYLLKFVKATPIAIVGMERCGKNTLAMTIAALRRIYYPMPMIACSPHANTDNPFPSFLPRIGYSNEADYRAIANHLRMLRRLVDQGDTSPVTTFWDECSAYPVKFAKEDQTLLTGFTLFCMSECAKHNKFQILSASGSTNDCLPGAEGTARGRGNGLITVFRKVEEGGLGDKFPSPEIVIERPSGRAEELLPKWINAAWLMQLFPEANEPIALPPHLAQVTSGGVEVTSTSPEVTSALEVPTTVGAEVTSERAEVRVVKASNLLNFPTSNFPTSQLPAPRKLLFLSLKSHLDSGKSITWVVEEVLKMKGRSFKDGKSLVESLIEEFGEKQ